MDTTKPSSESHTPGIRGSHLQHATPEQLVDALNGVFGRHAGARAVHAKGIDLEGVFRPADSAPSVSTALHFHDPSTPVTVRFSNFAGIPTIPDTHGLATPRGMSIKFHLRDGSYTDIVAHSYNGFPVATADEFREFLIALGSSGPDVPKPAPIESFLSTHPIARTFLESQLPPPVSYGTVSYFGVNTFKFTNSEMSVTFGRYQIRPAAGEQLLPAAEVAKAGTEYLSTEIRQRVGRGRVQFKLLLEIAGQGDDLDDPSIAWPQSRAKTELGTIEVIQAVADNAAAEHQLFFNPGILPSGIEARDPMIKARLESYPISVDRRKGD